MFSSVYTDGLAQFSYLLDDDSEQKLAAQLFDSLINGYVPLGDRVEMYPCHGAGSAGRLVTVNIPRSATNRCSTWRCANNAASILKREGFRNVVNTPGS